MTVGYLLVYPRPLGFLRDENMSQPVPPAQPRYSPDVDREFAALNRKACLCKLATKVTGCICLPLTYACGCISCGCWSYCTYLCGDDCCATERDERHPETHKFYSHWSSMNTCTSLARLPPKDYCERISQIWDPCVCLICCATETPQHYLNSKDQARWEKLYLPHKNNPIYLTLDLAREGFLKRGIDEPELLDLISSYFPKFEGLKPPPRESFPIPYRDPTW